ncbi:hypothetical protein BC332_13830 [Capsicum chinense]|nr:hypothetical protein BC332_13830 [Capsicum chinense]
MVNAIALELKECNIHVMIVYLLIILFEVPKDVIRHNKLFVIMAHVEALTKEVFDHILDEENMKKISGASPYLLENIELLKKYLKNVFFKALANSSQLCLPTSDGPLFMTFLLRNLKAFLNSNASSVALIKEEIGWA